MDYLPHAFLNDLPLICKVLPCHTLTISFLSYSLLICYDSCPNFPHFPLCPVPSFFPAHPCVMHVSSLASPFLIPLLTSPCLFCTYHLWFLIPAPFPPFSHFYFPGDDPANDLQIYDSVPVLVVCLVFCFILLYFVLFLF